MKNESNDDSNNQTLTLDPSDREVLLDEVANSTFGGYWKAAA
jgi:hypothetical protein